MKANIKIAIAVILSIVAVVGIAAATVLVLSNTNSEESAVDTSKTQTELDKDKAQNLENEADRHSTTDPLRSVELYKEAKEAYEAMDNREKAFEMKVNSESLITPAYDTNNQTSEPVPN